MKDNPLAVGAKMICDALDKEQPGWRGIQPREARHEGPSDTCPHRDCVKRREGTDAWFWRDVLGAMEDLIIDWQCRPCGCRREKVRLAPGITTDWEVLCKRCKVVRLCSQFKSTVEGS